MNEKGEEKETKNSEELRTKEQLESRDKKGKESERKKERKTDGEKMSERTKSCARDESERGCEFIEIEGGKRKKGRREGAADAPRQG